MKIHAELFFFIAAPLIGSHYSVMAGHTYECGLPDVISNVDTRIIGGVEATPHSWPWQVSIICSENNWTHRCGGSVIHPHWVITAAHCLYSKPQTRELSPSDFKIVLGVHNRSVVEGTKEVFEVSYIERHENHGIKTHDNDIALIRLKKDVHFNRYIKPICLPNVDDDVEDNKTCYVTGWGLTNYTTKQHGFALQQLKVSVISNKWCNQPERYALQVTENMICAGFPAGGNGTCKGDSGGPLVNRSESDGRWMLFGLVSWSEPKTCAKRNYPGLYTRVTRYLKWIQEKSGQEINTDNLPEKGTDGSSEPKPTETSHNRDELK